MCIDSNGIASIVVELLHHCNPNQHGYGPWSTSCNLWHIVRFVHTPVRTLLTLAFSLYPHATLHLLLNHHVGLCHPFLDVHGRLRPPHLHRCCLHMIPCLHPYANTTRWHAIIPALEHPLLFDFFSLSGLFGPLGHLRYLALLGPPFPLSYLTSSSSSLIVPSCFLHSSSKDLPLSTYVI